jgi:hypothetical protein
MIILAGKNATDPNFEYFVPDFFGGEKFSRSRQRPKLSIFFMTTFLSFF